jgi:hypothetical protein|nr:MAG TPA: hypothetical protein [Caudoviricetes sp.]
MAKYVSLNENAGIFHDIASGFTVYKGEIKELTVKAQASNKVKKAILNGHLVYAQPEVEDNNIEIEDNNIEIDTNKLTKKYKKLLKDGKLSNDSFTFDELVAIANSLEISVEDGDTADDIISVISEELQK